MTIRLAYLCAVAASLFAIGFTPSSAFAEEEAAGCTIHCSYCMCNTRTGICDCTNCEIKCSAT